jgi:hypothetical protein
MNPSYGYQLYQAGRAMSRAEMLAGDARRGRGAAAISRGARGAARKAWTWGRAAFGAVGGRTAGAPARTA